MFPIPTSRHRLTLCRALLAVVLAWSVGILPVVGTAQTVETVEFSTPINTELAIDLRSKLVPGDTVVAVDTPAFGTVSIEPNGRGRFMPVANFTGSELFNAWVTGSDGLTRAVPISVTVTGNPTSVEARGDSATTPEDIPTVVYPLVNDAAGPGGGPLSFEIESTPETIAVELNGDGSITVVPRLDWSGEAIVRYLASDGATSKAAEIVVRVESVPDLPTATADAIVIPQDAPAMIDILVNDFDGDGDPFSLFVYDQPLNGVTTWSERDRMIQYQPNPGFIGTDGFAYSLEAPDGIGYGYVTITVDGAPLPVNDLANVAGNSSTTINVLANDLDPEGAELTVSSVGSPQTGHAQVNLDNTVTYTPASGAWTTDSFTYSVTDPLGNTASAVVELIRVEPAAAPPVAVDDEFLVLEDSLGNSLDLLSNDQDPAGAGLVLTIETSPEHGTLVVDAAQMVTYVPEPEFSGSDSFTYAVSSAGGIDTALVDIKVQIQNDVPAPVADSAETLEDTPVTIEVLANDTDVEGDPLRVDSVSSGAMGTASVAGDSAIVYSPNPDAFGFDQISYVVSDGNGGTATGTVDLVIVPVPDGPIAADDSGRTDSGAAVTIDVLLNDRDPDGEWLTAPTIITEPETGVAVVLANGQIEYSPEAGYEGVVEFIYQVHDPVGTPAQATVAITVGDPNTKPEAKSDKVTTTSGTPVTIDAVANDKDADGDELEITRLGKPEHGSVKVANGEIVYTPEPGFSGTDTFTYKVSDGEDTDTGRVTVTVAASD